jgi:hypothetical protein
MDNLSEALKKEIVTAFPEDHQLLDSIRNNDDTLVAHLTAKKFFFFTEDASKKLLLLKGDVFDPNHLLELLFKSSTTAELKDVIMKIHDGLSNSNLDKIIKAAEEAIIVGKLFEKIVEETKLHIA